MGPRNRSNSKSSSSGGWSHNHPKHGEHHSKEDLWKGALEQDLGNGAIVQMIGMDSASHTVFARVVVAPSSGGASADDDADESAPPSSPDAPPAPSSDSTTPSSPEVVEVAEASGAAAASPSVPSPEKDATASKETKETEKDEPSPSSSSASSCKVTVMQVVETMVDVEYSRIVKDILERKEHIEPDSHPPASDLLRLGSVWLLNETSYSKGHDAHAHRLTPADAETIPAWRDYTVRVHYAPDRFHAANEREWSKYCRGLLVGDGAEARVGNERPHVPVSGMPDSKDGVIVYANSDLGFAIVDKPGGMPIHGTKTNAFENVVHMLRDGLHEADAHRKPTKGGKKGGGGGEPHRKIHVTVPHRCDAETHGLIVASTKKEFCSYYANVLDGKGAALASRAAVASPTTKKKKKAAEEEEGRTKAEGGGGAAAEKKKEQPAGEDSEQGDVSNAGGGGDVEKKDAAPPAPAPSPAADGPPPRPPPLKKKYRCLVCIKDPETMDKLQKFQDHGTVVTHHLNPKCPAPKKFLRHRPKGCGGNNASYVECKLRVTRVGGDDGRFRAACVSSTYGDSMVADLTLAKRIWNRDVNVADPEGASKNPADELGVSYVMQLEVELLNPEERPYQLRGQLAALGCPIVGDEAYGGGRSETGTHHHVWSRMASQCCEVTFPLPRWEERKKERKDDGGGGGGGEGEKAKEEEKVKEGGGGGGGEKTKVLVASDDLCRFRLRDAWWTPYLLEYARSV